MLFILSLLLLVSIVFNVILVWYTKKIVNNLQLGVNNVEELQKLLNEYVTLLEPLATMENYFNDPVITSAIYNTKLVAEACKAYKNTILQNENEEIQEPKEEEPDKKEETRKAEANITSA